MTDSSGSGSWTVTRCSGGAGRVVYRLDDHDRGTIGEIYGSDDVAEIGGAGEDARLIAAAPELLSALQEMARVDAANRNGGCTMTEINSAFVGAVKAIEKASQ